MGFAEDLQQAEQNLAAASAYHANVVNAAFAIVQRAERNYWARIRTLETEDASVQETYVKGLSVYEGITLYPDRVSDGETEAPLERGTCASVSTGGNLARGGASDKRTLSITIDFPNGMRIAAMGDPDKEGEARAFAALVMNAAAKLDGPAPTFEQELARLQRELDAARADTRELDAARAAYEAAYYDTAAVDAAQLALDELRARAPQGTAQPGAAPTGSAGDVARAQQNLAAASAYHANAVNAAFAIVQRAEQNYWARVRTLETEDTSVRETYVKGLSVYEGVTLYPDRVSDGETEVPLERGVCAYVSVGGNLARGGDVRTLSITIDFPSGKRITAMGDPNKEGEARAFAALVMNTAAELDGPPPTLEQELVRLQRELDAARTDTRELDAARAAYEAAYHDTAAVDAAQLALDELRARAPQGAAQPGAAPTGSARDVARAQQNLAAASAFHVNAINAAYAAVQHAERGYWERVRDLEAKVAEAGDAYAQGVSSCAGITLYPDRVSDRGATVPLERGVNASVSTGGNKYGQGCSDTRTLAITIDFPNGTRISAMGDPDKEGEARAFAALVMNTAAKLDGPPPTLEQEFVRLQRELDAARTDTRELDAARAAYEAVYYDTAAVDAARQALEALGVTAPQPAAATFAVDHRDRRLRDRSIVIAVVSVLAILGLLAIALVLVLAYSSY